MKKFINQVELVEDQMIQGMVKAYPQYVRKLDCGNVVVLRPHSASRPCARAPQTVAIISTASTGSKEQRIVERFMILDPLLPIVSQQFQRNAGYLQLEYTICKSLPQDV